MNMLNKFKKKLDQKGEKYLRIKVLPGAAKNEIKEILEDGTIKIAVKAVPEKGKANQELMKFLSKEFCVKKGDIKIISGQTDRIKLIKIKA